MSSVMAVTEPRHHGLPGVVHGDRGRPALRPGWQRETNPWSVHAPPGARVRAPMSEGEPPVT